jgi:hypothetical protein
MNGKVSHTEEDAHIAKEAMEIAQEEAAQAKQEASKAEEDKKAVDDNMVLLTKHVRKLEADLAASKESCAGVKDELFRCAIARDAAVRDEKKAHEDLEKEQTRSHSLFDDINRLKGAL